MVFGILIRFLPSNEWNCIENQWWRSGGVWKNCSRNDDGGVGYYAMESKDGDQARLGVGLYMDNGGLNRFKFVLMQEKHDLVGVKAPINLKQKPA